MHDFCSACFYALFMQRLRAFLVRHRTLALAAVLMAFCMKALLPGGTMLTPMGKVLTIALCDGTTDGHAVREIVVPSKSKPSAAEGKQACAFSALGMISTSGADPALLLIALAFVLALAFAPLPGRSLRTTERLRPPLRAPPSLS